MAGQHSGGFVVTSSPASEFFLTEKPIKIGICLNDGRPLPEQEGIRTAAISDVTVSGKMNGDRHRVGPSDDHRHNSSAVHQFKLMRSWENQPPARPLLQVIVYLGQARVLYIFFLIN